MEKKTIRWGPQDVIACIIILGCFALKLMGQDSYLSWLLLAIVAAYYGIDLSPFIKLGRNKKGG